MRNRDINFIGAHPRENPARATPASHAGAFLASRGSAGSRSRSCRRAPLPPGEVGRAAIGSSSDRAPRGAPRRCRASARTGSSTGGGPWPEIRSTRIAIADGLAAGPSCERRGAAGLGAPRARADQSGGAREEATARRRRDARRPTARRAELLVGASLLLPGKGQASLATQQGEEEARALSSPPTTRPLDGTAGLLAASSPPPRGQCPMMDRGEILVRFEGSSRRIGSVAGGRDPGRQ
ncbi:hypothetical protein KM043_003348 [Ampulex compressa]|nr:hypothetical protein KM043_003348 [Ampulex compressa]